MTNLTWLYIAVCRNRHYLEFRVRTRHQTVRKWSWYESLHKSCWKPNVARTWWKLQNSWVFVNNWVLPYGNGMLVRCCKVWLPPRALVQGTSAYRCTIRVVNSSYSKLSAYRPSRIQESQFLLYLFKWIWNNHSHVLLLHIAKELNSHLNQRWVKLNSLLSSLLNSYPQAQCRSVSSTRGSSMAIRPFSMCNKSTWPLTVHIHFIVLSPTTSILPITGKLGSAVFLLSFQRYNTYWSSFQARLVRIDPSNHSQTR